MQEEEVVKAFHELAGFVDEHEAELVFVDKVSLDRAWAEEGSRRGHDDTGPSHNLGARVPSSFLDDCSAGGNLVMQTG